MHTNFIVNKQFVETVFAGEIIIFKNIKAIFLETSNIRFIIAKKSL